MKITNLHIENFRSIRSLDVPLDETTVFIGPNNSGKSAILEAVRIALSRRWGQQGTGFTEADVHRANESADPRTSPPVRIGIVLEEPAAGSWPAEMITELNEIMTIMHNDMNRIAFFVTYTWDETKKSFEPGWEFSDSSGRPLPPRRRATNLSGLFNYILFFWLGALRDADDEFASRSRHWGGLLRSVHIPEDLETEVKTALDVLDAKLLAADPKLTTISETIGHATEVASGNTPGSARLRMLPLNIWDLLARAGILLRNEDLQPWLPLDHHGQGLQSLSVIFLLQAAVLNKLSEGPEGAEPIFAIEEPEVHLHPHAARTLWNRISHLPGQKLVSTHSPYFVQHVPLHNLRVVRFNKGSSAVAYLPKSIVSDLPWTTEVQHLVSEKKRFTPFIRDEKSGHVAATVCFNEETGNELAQCWSAGPEATSALGKVEQFRHASRILISEAEEQQLAFFGRRLRGEIFFAREWILVEGQSEYLLLHAIGKAYSYDLDQYGVSVIDFQNNGNAAIYPALADAFGIPWKMMIDGDSESDKFIKQLSKRGYNSGDLGSNIATLPPPNNLEDQLLADGHESLLRSLLMECGVTSAEKCAVTELKNMLKNRKTAYMRNLAPRVAEDSKLASQMPKLFVTSIEALKARTK